VEEKRVRAVLEWLRDLLAWASLNPEKLDTVLNQLTKHSKEIQDAFLEAADETVKPYVNEIIEFISGTTTEHEVEIREVAKATEEKEKRDHKVNTELLHREEERKPSNSTTNIHPVAKE